MKKVGFRTYFVVYLIALFLTASSGTLLKLFSVDPQTGFVNTGSFPGDQIFVYVFRLGLLLPILFWFLITVRRRAIHDFPVSYRDLPTSILSVITGISILAYTFFGVPAQVVKIHQRPLQNKISLIVMVFLGILAAISMIIGGIHSKYSLGGKRGGFLGFFPAVWALVLLMNRYNDFSAITTSHDVLLVILFLAFAAMFLIGQSRIVFGLGLRNGKTYAIPAALTVSLIGLSFVIPNIISFFVRDYSVTGLSMSLSEFCYILSLSLYSIVFLRGYAKSIHKV